MKGTEKSKHRNFVLFIEKLYLRGQFNKINFNNKSGVHRCGTGGSMCACHAAGPGSIPGRNRFPG